MGNSNESVAVTLTKAISGLPFGRHNGMKSRQRKTSRYTCNHLYLSLQEQTRAHQWTHLLLHQQMMNYTIKLTTEKLIQMVRDVSSYYLIFPCPPALRTQSIRIANRNILFCTHHTMKMKAVVVTIFTKNRVGYDTLQASTFSQFASTYFLHHFRYFKENEVLNFYSFSSEFVSTTTLFSVVSATSTWNFVLARPFPIVRTA